MKKVFAFLFMSLTTLSFAQEDSVIAQDNGIINQDIYANEVGNNRVNVREEKIHSQKDTILLSKEKTKEKGTQKKKETKGKKKKSKK